MSVCGKLRIYWTAQPKRIGTMHWRTYPVRLVDTTTTTTTILNWYRLLQHSQQQVHESPTLCSLRPIPFLQSRAGPVRCICITRNVPIKDCVFCIVIESPIHHMQSWCRPHPWKIPTITTQRRHHFRVSMLPDHFVVVRNEIHILPHTHTF